MLNAKWPEWVKASIAKHFEAKITSIALYVEGEELITGDRVELKTSGLNLTQLTKNQWKGSLDIFCDIMVTKNNDSHRLEKLQGMVAGAFTSVIVVKKYDEDESFVDCLTLVGQVNMPLLGQVAEGTREQQALVQASYKIFLEN
jgi:hypothetical protein